jgi:urea transport system permease protein
VVGAFFVNAAKSYLTASFSSSWLFFLGAIFVIVPVFLPCCIVGWLVNLLKPRRRRAGIAGHEVESI